MGCLLEQGVVGSNYTGMGKGTDHVVSFLGCTNVSLELVLPSRNHHPVVQFESVLQCHHPLLLLYWVGGKPVCHPQVSGLPF